MAVRGERVAEAEVDRLGSIPSVWVERHKYYPYGEETPATVSNPEKYATYQRDQSTNLDYAMNRYCGWQHGRFLTPDPYMGSSRKRKPLSWNRYVYAHGDPVNFRDPRGLFREDADYEEADDYDSFFDFWDIPGDDDPGERTERGMGDRPAQEDGGSAAPLIVRNLSKHGNRQVRIENTFRWLRAGLTADAECSRWLKGAAQYTTTLLDQSLYAHGVFENYPTVAAITGTGGTNVPVGY